MALYLGEINQVGKFPTTTSAISPVNWEKKKEPSAEAKRFQQIAFARMQLGW